jgi:hypothetical protein
MTFAHHFELLEITVDHERERERDVIREWRKLHQEEFRDLYSSRDKSRKMRRKEIFWET